MAINLRDLNELTLKRITSFNRFMEPFHRIMRENLRIYKGEFFVESDSIFREFYYEFKLAYSIIKGMLPSLVLSDPDILLTPRKKESVSKVAVAEKVINYYWPELKIKREVRKSVRDTLIYGFGVIKTGWQMKQKFSDKPVLEEDIGGQVTFSPNEFIRDEDLFVRRVSPFLFGFDPQATSFEDTRWVGEKIIRPVADVKRDMRYEKKIRNKVGGKHLGLQDVIFTDNGMDVVGEDPEQFAELWEVHDKERNLLITVSDGLEEPLRVIPYPFKKLEGTHYSLLDFDEIPDKITGRGLPEILKDQQRTINRIRTFQIDHVKRAVPKYVVSKQAGMKQEDIDRWANGTAQSIALVNGDARDIQLIQAAPIPPDQYRMADIAKGDMLQIAGTPPSRFGQSAGGRTSATEISTINQSEEFRLEDAKTAVEDFSADISRKMIQILVDKLSDEKIFFIVGEENFEPLQFTKSDIQGEFDFRVAAGSMAKPDRAVERQQLINLLNIGAQIPGFPVQDVFKEVLKTFPNLRNKVHLANQTPEQAPPGIGGATSEDLAKQTNPPTESDLQANIGTEAGNGTAAR